MSAPAPKPRPTLIGVLLAAGRGRRMGGAKQLLPWPPGARDARPLVAAAFDAVCPVCTRVIVVVGHEAEAVVSALGSRSFDIVHADPDAEMFESIRAGLKEVQARDPAAAALVHPADHPEVDASTLQALVDALQVQQRRALMPEYHGRGGHPVLIPAPLIPEIVASEGHGGLRQYWVDHPERCLRIPVDDPAVVRNLNTRRAYEQ
jgi:molybdenum cofactor cytidylyltransferase